MERKKNSVAGTTQVKMVGKSRKAEKGAKIQNNKKGMRSHEDRLKSFVIFIVDF